MHDAGQGRVAARAQQMNLVAVLDEPTEKPRRGTLDAAVEDERPTNDENFHLESGAGSPMGVACLAPSSPPSWVSRHLSGSGRSPRSPSVSWRVGGSGRSPPMGVTTLARA